MSFETIRQKCEEILERDNWKCQYPGCDKPAIEIAHRISKGQKGVNAARNYIFMNYGIYLTIQDVKDEYLNAPENVVSSCKRHNDNFNCYYKPLEVIAILDAICKRKGLEKVVDNDNKNL